MTVPLIRTDRLSLTVLERSDLKDIREYYLTNQAHLEPWEPARSSAFHDFETWRQRIKLAQDERQSDRAVKLILRLSGTQPIIGVCNFTNIVRGPFQACNLGYSIDGANQGRGLMFEALQAAITHMFTHERLHRIMANHVPENDRSARLLKRLGFEVEGQAKAYLHIAGAWRDHILTAKINPHHPA